MRQTPRQQALTHDVNAFEQAERSRLTTSRRYDRRMQICTAVTALHRAMDEVGLTLDSPSADRALEALSVFAREPIEGLPEGPDIDRLVCESSKIRVDNSTVWKFGIYRQVCADELGEEMFRFGFDFRFADTPELAALVPDPNAAHHSLIQLWLETSDIDRWLSGIRTAPAFPALNGAPVSRAILVADQL